MSSSGRDLRFWVRAWLPVVVTACLVAIESTPYFGADRTTGPLRYLWGMFFGSVSERHWHIIHLLIRKCGHFLGFGLVGLTWLRAWRITLPQAPFLRVELLALAGAALVASADEFHQNFLPNRTSSPRDVLLDCCGALATQLLVYFFLRSRKLRLVAAAE